MKRTKRQHFVPRCYLSRFSNDGKSVWAFDKVSKKKFEANVMGVAQENGFYDIPQSVLDKLPLEARDAQVAEKTLANGEAGLVGRIERLLDEVRCGRLTRPCQMLVSLDIAIQWVRTRQYRETIFEARQKLYQSIGDDIVRKNFPNLPSTSYPNVVCGRSNLPAAHVADLLNEDLVVGLASPLMNHIWVVAKNVTSQNFYTSDSPVVKLAHVETDQLVQTGKFALTGFRSPGIEIALPLSSRYILVLYERNFHSHMARFHGQMVEANAYDVDRYNCLQTRRSYRQVFCAVNQFEQAEGECGRHPECCAPDRSRVDVTSTETELGVFFRE